MLLALPTLSETIPNEIVFAAPNPHHLKMVTGMLELGSIPARAIEKHASNEPTFADIHALLHHEWNRRFEGLFAFEALNATATLFLPGTSGDHPCTDLLGECDVPAALLVLSGDDNPTRFIIGPTVMALEGLHPGLGFSALDMIDDVLALFCTPCTPPGALAMAQRQYWCWEEDDAAAKEAYGDEFVTEDTPTRAALFGHVPEEALCCTRHRLSKAEFTAHAAPHLTNEQYGSLLAHLCDLDRLIRKHLYRGKVRSDTAILDSFFEVGEADECFEPPAIVFWQENEQSGLIRVIDDYYNAQMEMGNGAPFSRYFVCPLTPENIKESLRRLGNTGALMQALDRVLNHLPRFMD